MEKKEKIYREKQLREEWLNLRSYRGNLHNILMNYKDISPMDRIIIYQCLSIILENICIYEDAIKNETNTIQTKTKSEGGISQEQKIIEEIVDAVELLIITMNDKEPLSNRLKAIEKIKNTAWKTVYDLKDQISDVLERFDEELELDDIGYIFACISLILLELDLKDEETKILNKMYG